jgi:hypothetical protein
MCAPIEEYQTDLERPTLQAANALKRSQAPKSIK